MGRYKEHRESRRRGYEGDHTTPPSLEWRPNNPRPSSQQGSESVQATVKWFNPEKGYGFVTTVSGSEAFMHVRRLEAAGHNSVSEGMRVKVRIGQGQKGPEVTEVVEVDTSTAQVARVERRSGPSVESNRVGGGGPITECSGAVKMYNAERGFGFVGPDGGGKDVFVHATTLERGGVTQLKVGQRVRMQVGQGQKGPEARSLELLD